MIFFAESLVEVFLDVFLFAMAAQGKLTVILVPCRSRLAVTSSAHI